MKNCSCNKKEKEIIWTGCDKTPIIKQLIDECSGRPVHYVTSACAVLMDGCETVEEAIKNIKEYLDTVKDLLGDNLENLKRDLDAIYLKQTEANNFATKTEFLELKVWVDWLRSVINTSSIITPETVRNWGFITEEFLNSKGFLTKVEAGTLYQAKGNYATAVKVNGNVYNPDRAGLVDLGIISGEGGTCAFTEAYKQKLEGIEAGALVNKVNDVIYNGNSIVVNKVATIPTFGTMFAGLEGFGTEDCSIILKACDVDGDDVWNVGDIRAINLVMFGESVPQSWIDKADVNFDGLVDLLDLNKAINYVCNKEPAPYKAYNANGQLVTLNVGDAFYCPHLQGYIYISNEVTHGTYLITPYIPGFEKGDSFIGLRETSFYIGNGNVFTKLGNYYMSNLSPICSLKQAKTRNNAQLILSTLTVFNLTVNSNNPLEFNAVPVYASVVEASDPDYTIYFETPSTENPATGNIIINWDDNRLPKLKYYPN